MGRTEIFLKVGEISENDVLRFREKQQAYGDKKTKISLEMNPYQRELEARQLKAINMRMKKQIEKGK